MPLFDFECRCGNVFDEFQKANIDGPRTAKCPKCGGTAVMKWSNGASYRFTFRDGFNDCTGVYHPTKKHYENHKREHGLVKVD